MLQNREEKFSSLLFKYFYVLVITVASIWLLPHVLMVPLWLIVIGFILYTKKNESYIISYFFIFAQAGNILLGGNPNNNTVLLVIGSRGITIIEVLTIVFWVKLIILNKRWFFIYRKWFFALIILSVWLFLYGYVLGMSGSKMLKSLRYMLPYAYFWTVFIYLKTYKDFQSFLTYCGMTVFLILMVQLTEIISGTRLTSLGISNESMELQGGDVLRQVYGTFLILITMIGISVFDAKHIRIGFKGFNWLVMFAGYLSILLSATRGYWLAASVILIIHLFVVHKINVSFKRLSYILVPLIFLVFLIPGIRKQIQGAYERLATVFEIVDQNQEVIENEKRFSERLPSVWNKYIERPVLGFGFSNDAHEFADVHVSYATNLLIGGIVGSLVWVLFYFFFIRRNYIYYLRSKDKVYLVLIGGFLAFLISGNTSTTVFTYLIGQRAFYLSVFFALANATVFNSVREGKLKKP